MSSKMAFNPNNINFVFNNWFRTMKHTDRVVYHGVGFNYQNLKYLYEMAYTVYDIYGHYPCCSWVNANLMQDIRLITSLEEWNEFLRSAMIDSRNIRMCLTYAEHTEDGGESYLYYQNLYCYLHGTIIPNITRAIEFMKTKYAVAYHKMTNNNNVVVGVKQSPVQQNKVHECYDEAKWLTGC